MSAVVVILRNAIRCKQCNATVVSKHRWDFVTCKCGAVSADGGHAYLKRNWPGGPREDAYEEMSVTKKVYKDAYGKQVLVGAKVVYGGRSGNSGQVKRGTVIAIDDSGVRVAWEPRDKWDNPNSKGRPSSDRLVVVTGWPSA